MAGFGLQPAGTTSSGFGTPPTAPTLTGKPLQNPLTGKVEGSRYIDPVLRDYRLNQDNRLAGMNNTQQLVHLAIHTRQTTSAIRLLGNRLSTIEVVTGNFEAQVLSILVEAVQRIIDDGLIEVLGFSRFDVGPNGSLLAGGSIGRFRYRDLATGIEHDSEV